MSGLNDPALIDWLATLTISIGVALIIAGVLSIASGRLLGLDRQHKLWAFIVGFAFLCSLAMAPLASEQSWSMAMLYYCLPLLATLVYFLPTGIAISRSHSAFHSVFIVNLFFGWTIAGWLAALSWAMRREVPRPMDETAYRITPFGAVPIHPQVVDPSAGAQQGKRSA